MRSHLILLPVAAGAAVGGAAAVVGADAALVAPAILAVVLSFAVAVGAMRSGAGPRVVGVAAVGAAASAAALAGLFVLGSGASVPSGAGMGAGVVAAAAALLFASAAATAAVAPRSTVALAYGGGALAGVVAASAAGVPFRSGPGVVLAGAIVVALGELAGPALIFLASQAKLLGGDVRVDGRFMVVGALGAAASAGWSAAALWGAAEARAEILLVGAALLVVVAAAVGAARAARLSATASHGAASLGAVAVAALLAVAPALPGAAAATPTQPDPGTSGPSSTLVADPDGLTVDFDRCGTITDFMTQLSCYTDFFDGVRKAEGVEVSLDLLVDAHRSERGFAFRTHCHEVLHELGHNEAEERMAAGDNLAKLLENWRPTCTGGYPHGLISVAFGKLSSEEFDRQFPTLCREVAVGDPAADLEDVPDTATWKLWACDHIMGHVLYERAFEEGDLVGGADRCLAWPGPNPYREDDLDSAYLNGGGSGSWRNCVAGYFMEYFLDVTRNGDHPDSPVVGADVFQLCRQVSAGVRAGCYSESGANAFSFSRSDFTAAFQLCNDEVPPAFGSLCLAGVGRMVGPSLNYETDAMVNVCAQQPQGLIRDRCAEAVAGSLVMEVQREDAARSTCDLVGDAGRRKNCLAEVEGIMQSIDDSGLDGTIGA